MGTSGDDKGKGQPKPPSKASLNQLTHLAHEHLQKGDLKKAMDHFESAAKQSREVGDNSVKISCYLNAGACLVSLGQYKRGLSFLESAASVIKTMGLEGEGESARDAQALEVSADVFYNTAVAAQGLREYDKAVANFKLCIDLYIKADAKQHAGEGFTSLASCHKEAGHTDKEIACLMSAQRLYSDLGDCSDEALVYVDLAKAYFRIDQRDECKQMLSTAKMLCLRVDDPKVQGKLHCQFGLIYTSLGMFDEAVQSFERVLPLVRVGEKTSASLQMEASILQNIGAAYNEKGLYSEGVIYHREAATLHGKTKNHTSEAKCLCNLAFAHTQLQDYTAATNSFSRALSKAQSAKNFYLQFQACEGLGAANYHLGQHDKAIKYFNQALAVLDEIKQDTGIARERVMEKLSDAMEALQKARQEAEAKRKLQSRSRSNSPGSAASSRSDSENASNHSERPTAALSTTVGSTHSLDRLTSKSSPRLLSKRFSPEMSTTIKAQVDPEKLPLPDKRASGFLPPIDSSRSPQLTARSPANMVSATTPSASKLAEGQQSSHKHTKPSHRKRSRKHKLPQITENGENGRPPMKLLDSYDTQLHAYMNTYREKSGESGLSSSSESNLSGGSQDSGDQLGASMFSRHATRTLSRKHRTTPQKLSPPPPSISQMTTPIQSPLVVQEGSLAIGPNAREMFTTQTHTVTSGPKRRRNPKVQTQIVPLSTPRHTSSGRSPPTEHPATLHSEQTDSNTVNTSHQSKVCLLL